MRRNAAVRADPLEPAAGPGLPPLAPVALAAAAERTRADPPRPGPGRRPLPPEDKANLAVDCRLTDDQADLLKKHAARTGVTVQEVVREIVERHLAHLDGEPVDLTEEIRVRLPERLYDPICHHALRTGVPTRAVIRALVIRHLASARW